MNPALSEFRAAITDLRHYVHGLQLEWGFLAALEKQMSAAADGVAVQTIDALRQQLSDEGAASFAPETEVDASTDNKSHQTDTVAKAVEPNELAASLLEHVGSGVRKRRYDYNSVIVSLYGVLEQFIEQLISNHVSWLNSSYKNYESLPEAIKKNHLERTLAIIPRLEASRYKNSLTAATLIRNLDSCFSNEDKYRLNTEAFVHHTANFRSDVIEAQFALLGLAQMTAFVRHYNPLYAYLKKQYPDRDITTLSKNEIFFFLDDLADRRNEVSHGSPSQLLSNETLLEYVELIDFIGSSICEWMTNSVIERRAESEGILLGIPIAVHNNSIVCFALVNESVSCGDLLIAVTGNGVRSHLSGEILELQVNGVSLDVVDAIESVNVAMRVDFKAKSNHSFVLVRKLGFDSESGATQPDLELGEPVDTVEVEKELQPGDSISVVKEQDTESTGHGVASNSLLVQRFTRFCLRVAEWRRKIF